MEQQWNKLPLAVIIGAILAAPAYAEVEALNGQGSIQNALSVDYDLAPGSENQATLQGEAFKDTQGIVHSNVAAGFANMGSNQAALGITASENDDDTFSVIAGSAQLSSGNNIELKKDPGTTDKDNSAILTGNAYQNSKGILGSNVAAGVGNVQANSAAVGFAAEAGDLEVKANSEQVVEGNTILQSGADNYAQFDGGFSGAKGVIGVNVSSGSINQQSNTVALAKGDLEFTTEGQLEAGNVVTSAGSNQTISGNTVTGSGEPHSFLGNRAITDGVFNDGANGVVGANTNAGDSNAQTNNAALAFYTLGEDTTGGGNNGGGNGPTLTASVPNTLSVDSSSSQTVENNTVTYVDNRVTASVPENNSSITNSFVGYQGIAGVNNTAGQANAQANNVAAAYLDNSDESVDTSVTASSEQSVAGNFTKQEIGGAGGAYGNMLNNATIGSGAFDGATGILGANSSAGQGNAQANNVSLAYLEGGVQNNELTQASSNQTVTSNKTAVDDPASAETNYSSSNAKLDSAFTEVQGIVGANVASGQNNVQANNAAVGYSTSQGGNATISAENRQDVTLNFASNFDNVGVIGDGVPATPIADLTNDASVEGSFEGASGVIGSSVAAGQANAQSNNAALAYNDGASTGSSDVSALNVQTVSGNYSALYGNPEQTENSATLGSSFNNASGIIGSNVTAGQANAQSNNASVAMTMGDAGSSGSQVTTGSLQVIGGAEGLVDNSSNMGIFDGGQLDNVASIGGSNGAVFDNANGILGVNVSAGQFNAQANNVSMVAELGDATLDATTVNIQASVLNTASYQAASENTATLSDSFNNASGVIGTNLAVGVGNGQANNVALHAGQGVGSLSAVAANIQLSAGNSEVGGNPVDVEPDLGSVDSLVGTYAVDSTQLADIATISSSTDALELVSVGNVATIDGNAYVGASGVIGVNVAAGVGNLQSNNVTISVASLNN
ncbi:beta strand repeat-containing protein [Vibrio brasiliensis]|uniref:beta strand repeat-containing protein n=1 Tax=Vibrio brasiliensis TaxID=170652 RepID=UPI001EFED623|nr:hypothetical protein [Vibrio brasiliensis]MCG9647812.1 hypothetical protein [Vibrio brasiliensis]MCG9726607.1 hypothetical protein [Vibrio brasiliensis]